jgi:glutaredoxin
MSAKLLLYSRADCCLCDEMKAVIREVTAKIPVDVKEVDVDRSPQLKELFGDEVPVLFIDGRKAFKYRVTAKELERRLGRGAFWRRLGWAKQGG